MSTITKRERYGYCAKCLKPKPVSTDYVCTTASAPQADTPAAQSVAWHGMKRAPVMSAGPTWWLIGNRQL
jgi:hypothetical protein